MDHSRSMEIVPLIECIYDFLLALHRMIEGMSLFCTVSEI